MQPENILFTSNWDFRLADFGVSIDLLKERAVTRAGTADYMVRLLQTRVVSCGLVAMMLMFYSWVRLLVSRP